VHQHQPGTLCTGCWICSITVIKKCWGYSVFGYIFCALIWVFSLPLFRVGACEYWAIRSWFTLYSVTFVAIPSEPANSFQLPVCLCTTGFTFHHTVHVVLTQLQRHKLTSLRTVYLYWLASLSGQKWADREAQSKTTPHLFVRRTNSLILQLNSEHPLVSRLDLRRGFGFGFGFLHFIGLSTPFVLGQGVKMEKNTRFINMWFLEWPINVIADQITHQYACRYVVLVMIIVGSFTSLSPSEGCSFEFDCRSYSCHSIFITSWANWYIQATRLWGEGGTTLLLK